MFGSGGETCGIAETALRRMLLSAPLVALAACGYTGHGAHHGSGVYIASNPAQWVGHRTVGSGECVALVQAATGAPQTAHWRPGPQVEGNSSIASGTAIATFDRNDHYAGHAAIYLTQDSVGLHVIDQWVLRHGGQIVGEHQPNERILPVGDPQHAWIDRAEFYRVVGS
jgi:hypothetical protein